HPHQEVMQDLSLARVLGLSRDEEPGEAGDGIRFLAGSVRDGDAIIRRDVRHRSRRRRDRIQIGLDEVARGVLYAAVVDVVLNSVDQFDVTDRAIDLTDLASHAFVALGSEAYGPLHARAFTDRVLPITTDLGEIVGPDEAGAAAIGAMDDDDRLV